jgi:hypothetical protein
VLVAYGKRPVKELRNTSRAVGGGRGNGVCLAPRSAKPPRGKILSDGPAQRRLSYLPPVCVLISASIVAYPFGATPSVADGPASPMMTGTMPPALWTVYEVAIMALMLSAIDIGSVSY